VCVNFDLLEYYPYNPELQPKEKGSAKDAWKKARNTLRKRQQVGTDGDASDRDDQGLLDLAGMNVGGDDERLRYLY